jgi:hypothetical protein
MTIQNFGWIISSPWFVGRVRNFDNVVSWHGIRRENEQLCREAELAHCGAFREAQVCNFACCVLACWIQSQEYPFTLHPTHLLILNTWKVFSYMLPSLVLMFFQRGDGRNTCKTISHMQGLSELENHTRNTKGLRDTNCICRNQAGFQDEIICVMFEFCLNQHKLLLDASKPVGWPMPR